MLYGFTVKETIELVGAGTGVILVFGGVVALFIELIKGINSAQIELPEWLGKAILRVPSGLAAIIIGGALLGFSVWKSYDTPPMHMVSGKIQLHRGTTVSPLSEIWVAVLPASNVALTGPDGGYSLDIPKGAKSYQALAYLPNSKPPLFHLGAVNFDPGGQGSFDYVFDERGGVK